MQSEAVVHARGNAAPDTAPAPGILTRHGELATVKAPLTEGNFLGVAPCVSGASESDKQGAEALSSLQKVALGSNAHVHAAAALLAALLGGPERAMRHAPMLPPNHPRGKYATRHRAPTDPELSAHLEGAITLAGHLVARDGLARAGVIELDILGEEGATRALATLAARGVVAFTIATPGSGGHNGSHTWALFDPAEPSAIQAQMRAAAAEAGLPTGEIWPTGQAIRLPFGVHRHTGRRGALLLQNGRRFDLDTPEGQAAGLAAVLSLPRNPAPAPLAPEPAPEAPRPSPAPLRAASSPRAGRTDARAVIARFKAEVTAEELLHRYGATRTKGGWKCNCGVKHTHDAQIYVDGGIIGFYSSRCGLAEGAKHTDRNGRPYFNVFDFFVQIEHGGSVEAALRAYNPIARRPGPPPALGEEVQPGPDAATLEARRKDAARKREARRAEAQATLADVCDRACEDPELLAYPTAAAVLRALLALAGLKTWCRPSVAGLAARLERSERTVQRALAWLEGRYISAEKVTLPDGTVQPMGSRPGKPHSTAIRTFLREPLRPIVTPQSAAVGVTSAATLEGVSSTPVSPDHDHEHVLDHASGAGEGGAEDPGPLGEEAWAALLVEAPPLADLVDPAAVAAWDVEGALCAVPAELLPEGEARQAPAPKAPGRAPEAIAFPGGASFDPAAAGQVPAPRRPRSLEEHFQALRDLYAWLPPPAHPGPAPALPDLEEEPEVRGPPRDPKRAAEYWKLRGKAQRATSARQKRYLLARAAGLEEWRPARGATARALAPPSPAPGPAQAALFG